MPVSTLKVGDRVVYCGGRPSLGYRDMGTVAKITPKWYVTNSHYVEVQWDRHVEGLLSGYHSREVRLVDSDDIGRQLCQ